MRWCVRAAALGLVMATTGACRLPPMISDTGLRGTWSRGNRSYRSIVAITEVEGRWYFRWAKRSQDGSQTVVCDWEGRCDESFEGRTAATYAITTRYDPGSQTLAVDTVEDRVYPSRQTLRYSELVEVAERGASLRVYTTDRGGQHFEGGGRPWRSFSKVADSVADPPRDARR